MNQSEFVNDLQEMSVELLNVDTIILIEGVALPSHTGIMLVASLSSTLIWSVGGIICNGTTTFKPILVMRIIIGP